MKCENCNSNEATVLYTEKINGRERRMNLCLACAKKLEVERGFFASDFFGGDLLSPMFYHGAKKKDSLRCPLCASDFSAIERSGKVGCPVCYTTFAEQLGSTLRKLHGTATHIGRKPQRLRGNDDEIKTLEASLKAAIEKEEYETAADIRDKIKEIRARGDA